MGVLIPFMGETSLKSFLQMKLKPSLQTRCFSWAIAKSTNLLAVLAVATLLVSAYFLLGRHCGIQCVNHYAKEIRGMKEYKTIDSFFDRFFIINMERRYSFARNSLPKESVKRKERMQKQMEKFEITNYEFFKAIDGSKLDINKLKEEGVISKG